MSKLDPKKGRLLVAEPSILNDNSFNRAIVLLTEHTDSNSVGFILNKPLEYSINDLLPEIDCSFNIYQGGPVEQDNLYFVHRIPQLLDKSVEVANGVFWGGDFKQLKNLLNEGLLEESDIRFFLGYSGWDKNQLTDELNEKSWFVAENDFDNIFSNDQESLWKNKLLQKGGNYKLWANAPDDFNLN
ncbi:YqgE/AlgH family protein [Polaribacter sp. PL03]|uniref:YqgE/AlgH family protein n=1 Tax=Polaribacter sp. PL03 TaxID=3088353 RepID=UPI0029CD622B|nr:YqgE/AlgH family protein [Polaribacter sp. PL03]MDX6746996.1 YqgE/AlgH family protein [Polaribacter sp. PL03]